MALLTDEFFSDLRIRDQAIDFGFFMFNSKENEQLVLTSLPLSL
jgi:hypothetical protein